jgi:hypothetical protein
MKLLASAYLMLDFYGTTNTQVPIVILKSEGLQHINDKLANRTVQLITDYYNLDENSERYLKIKVRLDRFHNGFPRELIVYRLYRERYLYETDRLFIDENFTVIKEEKNIKV